MLNCAKQTSFTMCRRPPPLHSIEARGKISSSEILDFGSPNTFYQTHSSISVEKNVFSVKKKKQNFQIMWPLFQAIHVPSSILGSLFSTQELQLGLVWRRGALALHLLKPLARENAQPSEDYVCTISKPGTTSKNKWF